MKMSNERTRDDIRNGATELKELGERISGWLAPPAVARASARSATADRLFLLDRAIAEMIEVIQGEAGQLLDSVLEASDAEVEDLAQAARDDDMNHAGPEHDGDDPPPGIGIPAREPSGEDLARSALTATRELIAAAFPGGGATGAFGDLGQAAWERARPVLDAVNNALATMGAS